MASWGNGGVSGMSSDGPNGISVFCAPPVFPGAEKGLGAHPLLRLLKKAFRKVHHRQICNSTSVPAGLLLERGAQFAGSEKGSVESRGQPTGPRMPDRADQESPSLPRGYTEQPRSSQGLFLTSNFVHCNSHNYWPYSLWDDILLCILCSL